MLNTVPRGVVLTDVIEPLDTKPSAFQLQWAGNGDLLFRGEVRVSAELKSPQFVVDSMSDSSGICKKILTDKSR